LLWLEAKVGGDTRFDGLAFRIAGEVAPGYAAERFDDARRAGECVLVEVEAKTAAIAEGWVVLLHATDGC
jgi:hypothetical protein